MDDNLPAKPINDIRDIPPAQSIAMLAAFCGGLKPKDIASQFNLPLPVVNRLMKRDKWTVKRKAFLLKFEGQALRRTRDELNKSISILTALEAQLVKEFKEDIESDKGSRVIPQERIDKLLKVMEKKLQLMGLKDSPPEGGTVQNVEKQIVLSSLDGKDLETLRAKLMGELGLEGEPKGMITGGEGEGGTDDDNGNETETNREPFNID